MMQEKVSPAQSRLKDELLRRDRKRRGESRAIIDGGSPHALRNDPLPHLRLVEHDPRTLSYPPRKLRQLSEAHTREIANAISNLGFRQPVLIDEGGAIIDGVTRVEAAKLLGLETISCVVAGPMTPTEKRLLRLAVNRLGEKGSWDADVLKIEFEELILEDAPVQITGFDDAIVDSILAVGSEASSFEKGQLAPHPGQRAVSVSGDVFRLGDHRVICGDARSDETLAILMGADQARLVLTDPPYNVPISGNVTKGPHREFMMATGEMSERQFKEFNNAWLLASTKYLVDGGLVGSFIDWRGLTPVSLAAQNCALKQINLVIWYKTNGGMGSLYRSQHEALPIFKKGDASHVNNVNLGRNGRSKSNVWSYAGASTFGSESRKGLVEHPTVKPTAMLVDAMFDLSNRGDIVLDPFLGSGSTLIAAEKAGRVCRGIEIDPLYVDVILRRYKEETGKSAILEETGEAFEVLEERRLASGAATAEDPAVADEPAVVSMPSEGSPVVPKVRERFRSVKPVSE